VVPYSNVAALADNRLDCCTLLRRSVILYAINASTLNLTAPQRLIGALVRLLLLPLARPPPAYFALPHAMTPAPSVQSLSQTVGLPGRIVNAADRRYFRPFGKPAPSLMASSRACCIASAVHRGASET
jgi:hypothetical protein